MMEWTDRHYRFFMRQITRRTLLYTEMVPAGAVLYGDRDKYLAFSEIEKPLVLQLGGDDPQALAEASVIAEEYGYDEVNLNVGCPSDRVREGSFGACLMAAPEKVRDSLRAMREAVNIPVSVKHRIGINGLESYSDLKRFVAITGEAEPDRFTVHARIAVLGGLSPKENRSVPPLRYDDVYRLKADFEHNLIEINGGIETLDTAGSHLEYVDGVMIGRAAYHNPFLFAAADQRFYDSDSPGQTRRQILATMAGYIAAQQQRGVKPRFILRHMMGLFAACPGARRYRRLISNPPDEEMQIEDFISEIYDLMPDEILDGSPGAPINQIRDSLSAGHTG